MKIDEQIDSIKPEWVRLVAALVPDILDDYRASQDPDDDTPAIELTIGFTPERKENRPDGADWKPCSWNYLTGDNSFTGGAYGHPHWAVVTVTRDCDPAEVASEIAEQLGELAWEDAQ